MTSEDGNTIGEVLLEVAAVAAKVPALIGVTALGAAFLAGRELVRLASNALPSSAAEPRPLPPHARRIRESARAAERAARASGLLLPRRR